MIYFLYGEDSYRSKRKLEEIVEHYKGVHKSGLNLKFLNGESLDYQDFKDEFQQVPMFRERKLIIIKNIFQNQRFKDSFLESGKKLAGSADIIVFHEDGSVLQKDQLFEFLTKNAKVQDFSMLEAGKLRNWVKSEFGKYKSEIQPQAILSLIDYTGNDLWRVSNEICKLAAFKRDEIIETKDVDLLVKPEIETDIFRTIEAMAKRNKKLAISLVHKHLEKGDNPLYLLAMICSQFRNLLTIKKTGKLHGHPYFVRKTAELAESFTLEELKKIYRWIFETDLKIKTGQSDPQTSLDLLIAEI